jgi:hypothetical protein
MITAAFYREEARSARISAASTPDPEAALRWRRIAEDYDTLADALGSRVDSARQANKHQQQAKADSSDEP